MNVFSVHSCHGSHLGFVTAEHVDAAFNKAISRWGNAYGVFDCWQLNYMADKFL